MVVCLAALVASCGRPDAPAVRLSRAEQHREATLTAAAVAKKLAGGSVPACGSAAAPAQPGAAVMINAQQCLSCRDLGYMLRRLKEHAPAGAVVVVPAGDTTAVCPFLRQERVRLPVLAVADADRALAKTRTLTFYATNPGPAVASVHFGMTGTELLTSLQTRARIPEPPPAPPSGT